MDQDPNDPPAKALIKEIEAEKKRLIKAGKIKKQKPLPPIKEDEIPYDLPDGWEWCQLQDLGEIKLVPQNPNDQPAERLLKEIAAEKNRLIKAGKIKKQKSLPPIKEGEIPYGLPNGWVWCQLQDIGEINPRNIAENEMDAAFVPMPSIKAEYWMNPIVSCTRNGSTFFWNNYPG